MFENIFKSKMFYKRLLEPLSDVLNILLLRYHKNINISAISPSAK